MMHSATCSNIPVYIDIEYTCNQSVFLWNKSMLYMYHINILYFIWLILIEFSVYTYFISFSVFYIGATTVSAEVKPFLEKSIKFLYMQAGIAQADKLTMTKLTIVLITCIAALASIQTERHACNLLLDILLISINDKKNPRNAMQYWVNFDYGLDTRPSCRS